MRLFTALEERLSSAVDARLSERLRFTMRARGNNWSRETDVTRPSVVCVGTFFDGDPAMKFADGDRANSEFNSRASTQEAIATADRRHFAAGREPKAGDLVELLDRNPIQSFEIIDVYTQGSTRLVFPLMQTRTR